MKKFKKRIIRFTIVLALVLVGTWVTLHFMTKTASEKAVKISQNNNVSTSSAYQKFGQKNSDGRTIIIYGGGLVESQSYAPLAYNLSKKGHQVYLLQSPLNLPILNASQASQLIKEEKLKDVYLIGHSLGGVVAAKESLDNSETVTGLVLLASYPDEKVDLSKSQLNVLSITASHDNILDWEKYRKSKKRLPSQTTYLDIKGGNHSGFGSYEQQAGDGHAVISKLDQETQIMTAILKHLENKK